MTEHTITAADRAADAFIRHLRRQDARTTGEPYQERLPSTTIGGATLTAGAWFDGATQMDTTIRVEGRFCTVAGDQYQQFLTDLRALVERYQI